LTKEVPLDWESWKPPNKKVFSNFIHRLSGLLLIYSRVRELQMSACLVILLLCLGCILCAHCIDTIHADKIYVYDWPELANRYANFTDRDHTSHGVEVPVWRTNRGAGRLVEGTNLEHKTSQFALHKIYYERALISR